jgi:hypothetical protein
MVAEVMTINREVDKAKSVLAEAQRAAQQCPRNVEKSLRLASVAMGLARLHQFRLAREAADRCASWGDKLAAYTAIFREYTIGRNPQLRSLFDGSLQR